MAVDSPWFILMSIKKNMYVSAHFTLIYLIKQNRGSNLFLAIF